MQTSNYDTVLNAGTEVCVKYFGSKRRDNCLPLEFTERLDKGGDILGVHL